MLSQKKVSFELRSLGNLIKRFTNRELDQKIENKLTPMQMGVILFLYKNQERDIFQRDIEKEFLMRRSTVSSLLGNMESKELIIRKAVSHDARLKKISLTKQSLELRIHASAAFEQLENQLKKDISEDELCIFFTVVEKMKQNIK